MKDAITRKELEDDGLRGMTKQEKMSYYAQSHSTPYTKYVCRAETIRAETYKKA